LAECEYDKLDEENLKLSGRFVLKPNVYIKEGGEWFKERNNQIEESMSKSYENEKSKSFLDKQNSKIDD